MSLNPHDRPGLRPGHQPYDALAGARVGAAAGGLIGAVLVALLDATSFWWVLAAAIVGGLLGYMTQRRRGSADGDAE